MTSLSVAFALRVARKFMSDKELKLGDLITLDVEDVNNLGCGVARHGSLVVFVKGGVSGDKVSATVIKITKSFAVAKLEKIISPSPYREDADSACTEKLSCGGCVFRGIKYSHELEKKREYVRSAFTKAGIPDAEILDVVSTDKVYRYRNKAQYPVSKTKAGVCAGFYAAKTHNVIPINDCKIQNEAFAPVVDFVCKFADRNGISVYDEKSGKGLLRHVYLRSADVTGELMLCLVISGDKMPCEDDFVSEVKERFPQIISIMINKNAENTNVVLGEKYRCIYGKPYIEDVLCGLRFKIAPEAFYQVNRDGAELLYSKAAELAECGGEDIIDLYCGTGTIGLSMANKASRLLGIDIVEKSIECARENAAANNVENAFFVATDAGKSENIRKAAENHGFSLSASTVIMDPPRKGSTPELLGFLAAEKVKKIVYISCNPDTLARDAATLLSLGYTMSEVTPVNMFPRTGHVESVVAFRI